MKARDRIERFPARLARRGARCTRSPTWVYGGDRWRYRYV